MATLTASVGDFAPLLQQSTPQSAVQTHAQATVTITDPGAGVGGDAIVISEIEALYTGGASGLLTITQGNVVYSVTLTGAAGQFELPQYACYLPTGQGNVVVALADGGVGIIGVLVVYSTLK